MKRLIWLALSLAVISVSLTGCGGGGGGGSADTNGSAYSNASLSGVWINSQIGPNLSPAYWVADGNGNFTKIGAIGLSDPPGTYQVNSDGTFSAAVLTIDGSSIPFTGKLTGATSGTATFAPDTGSINKVTDLSLCQGEYSGTINDGSATYNISFSVDSNGVISNFSSDIPGVTGATGKFFGVGSTATFRLETNLTSDPYGIVHAWGTLSSGQFSGSFENDSDNILGTISVTKNSLSAPSVSGSLIYHTNVDGNFNIYKSNLDGSQAVALTTDSADDYNPEVSFDNTKIVFRSLRSDTRSDLWVMNADGSNQIQLTDSGSAEDQLLRWSTDGNMITFSSYRPYGTGGRVMVINSDGTSEADLYYSVDFDSYPAGFTSDNTRIIFFRQYRYGEGGATMMNIGVGGSNPVEIADIDSLVGDSGTISQARVSKDGQTVVFAYYSINSNKYTGIYTIKVDGTNLTKLSYTGFDPNWTSDGGIVYSDVSTSGVDQLWVMNSDGTGKKQLLSDGNQIGGGNIISN